MDVEIVKNDGSKYRLSDYGVVYDFVVGSIAIEQYDDRVIGRPGKLDYGADYTSRRIKVPMKFKHGENHHYAHLRDELYGVLTDTQAYFIREMRRPRRLEYEFVDFGAAPRYKPQTDDRYVNGKQYLVRMVSELEPEQLYNGGEIEIEFETTALPFAESIYTSMELNDNGYSSLVEKFGLANNLDVDRTAYKFKTNKFEVWNAGNVEIDPLTMYLKFYFINLVSTTGKFTIVNETTGDEMTIDYKFGGHTLTIEGVIPSVSQYNLVRYTNKALIKLAPGLNVFTIKNATYNSVAIDFKFLYK